MSSMTGRLTTVGCLCGALLFGATGAAAQEAPQAPQTPKQFQAEPDFKAPQKKKDSLSFGQVMKDTLGDFKRLPKDNTVPILALGATFAATALTYDRTVSASFDGAQASSFKPGAILGGAEFQFGASVGTYAIGRLTGNSRVAEVGAHLMRAQIVSQVVTHSIKAAVKRTRPDGSTQNSFPSGHTSVSFASATVLQREFGWKVGIPAYAVASYIGFSRVEGHRHYVSDVLFGAAIGVMAGRAATVDIAGNRFLLAPSAGKGGGAVSFVWAGKK
jgi:membrane-associated phospholipid phosphatase